MPKTFTPADLALTDPASPAWALAWARQFAGDTPNAGGAWPLGSWDDAIWTAYLAQTTRPGKSGGVCFRPHEAAARAILANPNWVTRETIEGYSTERRTAEAVAAGIRAAGSFADDLAGNGGTWQTIGF